MNVQKLGTFFHLSVKTSNYVIKAIDLKKNFSGKNQLNKPFVFKVSFFIILLRYKSYIQVDTFQN